MSTPANLTHAEVGALLMAVGTVMVIHNVCAGAALDGGSKDLLAQVLEVQGIVGERMEELLQMGLQHAIDFVDVGGA